MSQRPTFLRASADLIDPDPDEDGLLLTSSHDGDASSDDMWAPRHRGRYPSPRALRADPRMPKPFLATRTGLLVAVAAALALAVVPLLALRNSIRIARLRHLGVPPGLYSREGTLFVGQNTPFSIKGFSWYGMEDPLHMPGGLDKVSVDEIFDFTRKFRFNAIRLPLSVENIVDNKPGHTMTFRNPELTGLEYLDVIKAIVKKAANNNVLILLDIHRLKSHTIKSTGLWYSDDIREDRLFHVWNVLCDLVKDHWNVMGADIFNEPWDALWNSGNTPDDWKSAAERLGNAIHTSCPSWTIFIEGIGNRHRTTKTKVYWAENLRALQVAPPQLELKNKVVLSPHVYGPSVHNQSYFQDANFPDNMPAIWDDHFGEASRESGLATVIGEWGGHFVGMDKKWQLKFLDYLNERKISFFYWSLNPDSVDTGGLMHNDWRNPEANRLSLLESVKSTSVKDYAVHFKHWRNWRV